MQMPATFAQGFADQYQIVLCPSTPFLDTSYDQPSPLLRAEDQMALHQ